MQHISRKYWFTALLVVQCALLLIAFNKFFVHSDDYMFMNHGDGFKNYYTLHSYLQQGDDTDFWKFEQMNYPYGDYVFFTDNTPLLAVSVKLFSKYIYDISDHGVFILNLFCILGILLSVVLCWKILSRFIRHNWMLFVFSLSFVWLNPQILRLKVGHFNLSFSWLLLLCIWWLIRLAEVGPCERVKAIRLSVYLFLTIVAASFFHLYYAMLLSVVVGSFFLAWAFTKRKDIKAALRQLSWGIGISAGALVTVLGIIRLIDGYYAIRKSTPEGYDFGSWRLKMAALFSEREWNTIGTPFSPETRFIHESGIYLGSFCVYGLWVVLLLWLLRSSERISWKDIRENDRLKASILGFLMFAGVLSIFIALGEKHYFFGTKHKFYNLLNPFLYLGMVTDTIKQFRCLGRFSWVFYWVLSFGLLYILQFYWEQGGRFKKALVILLTLCAVIDTANILDFQNHQYAGNNLTHTKHLSPALKIADQVNIADYQALMPLPFYHNGSEDYNHTVDPPEDFYIFMVQMAEKTGLPCMGSKMSRTPPAHPKSFLSIFLDEQPAPELLEELNDKPILVVVNKKHLNDRKWFRLTGFEPTNTAVKNMPGTIEKYGMTLLYEEGNYALYRWDVK